MAVRRPAWPPILDRPDQPVLLVESRAVCRRRPFHRQKAHLLLSALRHRAADLGEQALYLATDTYREALDQVREPLSVLAGVRDRGWVHHIPRLMVLGNYALQRGFVDGYDWVMVPNVVGMSQHADGGLMATKPYAAGGAYINRMSDYVGRCPYRPTVRVGDPYTAGYWWFLSRNEERLRANFRMAHPVRGLRRLTDLDAVDEQEEQRGSRAP